MDDTRTVFSAHAVTNLMRRSSPRGPRRRAGAVLVSLAAFLSLLLVGCGAGGATSSGNASAAQSKVCQGITNINQSLTQLSTAGDNTTVGQVKAIQQKLTTALDAVAKVPGGGGSALSNLKSANDQLAAAIGNLPDSAPISQAGPQFQNLQGKASQAQSAVTKLSSTLHCAA